MYSIQASLLLSFIDEYSLHDLQRYPIENQYHDDGSNDTYEHKRILLHIVFSVIIHTYYYMLLSFHSLLERVIASTTTTTTNTVRHTLTHINRMHTSINTMNVFNS